MRKWKVSDPDQEDQIFTEADILAQYYHYWQKQMTKVGKADQISPEACIEDWVAVNWAEEIK